MKLFLTILMSISLVSSTGFAVYTNNLKSWEFDKEATQNFLSGASDHCLWQGASEDKNFDAKPTSSKTSSSSYLCINKHWKASGSQGSERSYEQERDYWEELAVKEKEDVSFIINTLAYKSLASVFYKKKQLEEAGDRINHLHPLRFLLVILSDPKLNAGVRAIYSRDLLWGSFVGGIYTSLKEESDKDNLREECVNDFCFQLKIEAADIQSEIIQALQAQSWDVFMKLLFLHVPRNEGFDRYDM